MATKKQIDSITSSLQQQLSRLAAGKPVNDNKIHTRNVPATDLIMRGLAHFCGASAQWLPEYSYVADWLANNHGKGLLCYGNCGRGKTLITQRILPVIFQRYGYILSCFTALDLNEHYKDIECCKLICIDDVGTEPEQNDFGERHWRFSELVDLCERKDKLLIVSTNMTGDELLARYGERTIDRLATLTTQVLFKGNSLRK